MDSICLKAGIAPSSLCHVTTPTVVAEKSAVAIKRRGQWRFSFKSPLRSIWPGTKRYDAISLEDAVLVEERERETEEERETESRADEEGEIGVWRRGKREREEGEDDDVCRVYDYEDDDDDDKVEFDRSSFSKMLRRVSLSEARLYARMSYLGNLAYCIPMIKPKNLLKVHGLRFVTSSFEKKEIVMKAEIVKAPEEDELIGETFKNNEKNQESETKGSILSPSTAYNIAASAASYLHTRTKSIVSFTSSKSDIDEGISEENCGINRTGKLTDDEIASIMAKTTDVVSAKEEVKQAVADDLNSISSSPCEWYICDDDLSGTRYLVIQGSETLASWQANLLFEPIMFEGLDVPVHRGIYEAAKGIYEQMLPEIRAHIKFHGERATFRFTGHSLGGSLSLLINLMLLKRGEVPVSSLLPVITFGAPSIMCGGDRLLRELGLPRSHVQSIMMHRDIVPRAFSCNYPSHVAELLKAVNGNFRNHPCLNNQKLLYAPMGELLILQPDEKHSPNHDLLPPGSGLYMLNCPSLDTYEAEKQLRAAKSVFFNSPHPLEILRDRSAYGSDGTVQRDHDMNSYLKSVRSVIRQELNQIRRAKREQRHEMWWPIVASRAFDKSTFKNTSRQQFHFSGILQMGTRSLKRFTRLVASQNIHFLVLLVPARLLVLGTFGVTKLVS